MSEKSSGYQNDEWVHVLDDFLASPPEGVPAEIIEAFGAVQTKGAILPPRVFFEVVEQSSIAISITDTQAGILYVNRAFQELTGYADTDVIGKNESILSYKATPKSVYNELWSTILEGRAWNGFLVNRRKDGSRYLAELSIAPVLDAKGAARYFLGMHRDVTEMHNLEKRVRNQKEMIESVVDSAPVVIALLDMQGKVMLDNRAYKTLMADLDGHEPAEQFLVALADVLGNDLETACARERGFINREVRLDQAGGAEPRWFSCSGSWVKEFDLRAESYFENKRQSGLLLVANEITAQKRQHEQARISAVRAVMAEQSMAQNMRETLSGAIFQMQGPLNMIEAAIGMSQFQASEQQNIRKVLEQVLEAGQQAMQTLRASIPAEAKEPQGPVNINEVVRDVLNVLTERLLTESVVVDWRPAPVLPTVFASAGNLRAMVKYLLDNAIDAVKEPGCRQREIIITTQMTQDGRLEIVIEDHGPGIPADMRLKVFEPFFSNWKNSKGRAGMGLSMVQQIAIDFGGDVEIEPEFIGGCRVRISIPTNETSKE